MTHGATLLLDECENTGVSEGTRKVLGGEDTLFGGGHCDLPKLEPTAVVSLVLASRLPMLTKQSNLLIALKGMHIC